MDDNHPSLKYDLRETRFSQNLQHSLELYQKQELQTNFSTCKTTRFHSGTSSVRYLCEEQSIVEENQSMVCNKDSVMISDDSLWGFCLEQDNAEQPVYLDLRTRFQEIEYQCPKLPGISTFETSLLYTANKPQQHNDNSDSDQTFSEKLSIIRSLQHKLSTLHQKIKLPPNPITYLEQCKLSLQKQYQTYARQAKAQPSYPLNQLSQYSQYRQDRQDSQYRQDRQNQTQNKSFSKNYCNDSIESESMLLDKDFQLYCNEKEIPKIITLSFQNQPGIQVIETVRIVQVPYLIEVNRQLEKQIESKKSFYFEQNQDIHKIFEQFTQKQAQNENLSHAQKTFHQQESLYQQASLLSVNEESNKTFHNGLKEKRDDISFNYDENSNQILSKLDTRQNQREVDELEDKVKCLQIENSDLREKVKQLAGYKEEMETQRYELAVELMHLSESEQFYEKKLNSYKQQLQGMHQEFAQILHLQQSKLKEQYGKQIQQFQIQQSEYANRIIAFEERFEEEKQKQLKFTSIIDSQLDLISDLQKLCQEKDTEVQTEIMKKRELEDYVVQRETQLKLVIENLDKDNSQLHHLLHQMQLRYESEGFYILNQEAIELKHALEHKDTLHYEQLSKIQNRYSDLIERYQHELETMKKALEKVRLDKSASFQSLKNTSNPNIHYYPSAYRKKSPIKKRQSLLFSRANFLPNHDMSVEGSNRREKDISVSQFSQHSSFSQPQQSSLMVTLSVLDRSQQLLLLQLETMRQQNDKLQQTLISERQQKHILSNQLSMINSTMEKYLNDITSTEEQQDINQETFFKCVHELKKQFKLNQKLKLKLNQLESSLKSQNQNQTQSDESVISMNEEQVKVHPILIQFNQVTNTNPQKNLSKPSKNKSNLSSKSSSKCLKSPSLPFEIKQSSRQLNPMLTSIGSILLGSSKISLIKSCSYQ